MEVNKHTTGEKMTNLWDYSIDSKKHAVIKQDGNKYTYEQLYNDVFNLSNKIKSSDKKLILLLSNNNYQSLLGYLAVLRNNDAVMLINAELDENLIQTIIDSYKPEFIFGKTNHPEYCMFEENILKRTVETNYSIHQDLALLLSTSGTTGSIKFVRLSYANLMANAKSISEYLEITPEHRGCANLPMHYSYGLSIINSHLYSGATLLLTDESILSKGFWDFLENERATSLAGVPYTYQMLQRIGFHKMDLPHLRYFTQAGGRLNEKYVRLFGQYAADHKKNFYVMYGQTEATARISYVTPDQVLEKPTSIGKAIPDGRLFIETETNELVYEGPNVMMGYAESFLDLAKGDELYGQLHTGDLAEMDKDGYFYIKGRIKRFIKLFGLRLNLDDIENQIESTLNTNVVCVGTDDKLVIAIKNKEQEENIQDLIEKLYKLHRSAFRIKVVEEFPRLPNGKINYELLKDLV